MTTPAVIKVITHESLWWSEKNVTKTSFTISKTFSRFHK